MVNIIASKFDKINKATYVDAKIQIHRLSGVNYAYVNDLVTSPSWYLIIHMTGPLSAKGMGLPSY